MSNLTPPPDLSSVEPSKTARPSTFLWIFQGPEGLRAGWGLLLFAILLAAISAATQFAVTAIRHKVSPTVAQTKATITTSTSPKEQKLTTVLVAEGASFAVVILVTFLMGKIERRPTIAYGLGGGHRFPQFLQGFLLGAVCLSLLVATLRLTGLLHFDVLLLHGPGAVYQALLWSIAFTLVAFLEETLLRGYLQYTLARGLAAIVGSLSKTSHRQAYGFWTAALLLSFVFGLGHNSNPGESPIGLLSAGLAGLVFSLALYRTGSLWWAIGFHASWDWAQSFLYGVADSGTMIQHHLFATHPVGKTILSGGLTGPEGSLFVIPTLALVTAIIVYTLPASPLKPSLPDTGFPSDPTPAPSSATYRR